MKNTFIIYTSVFVFALSLFALDRSYGALPVKDDSLRFEVMLSNKLLNDKKINTQFIESVEITTGRLIMLSSSNQFYLLGWGDIQPMSRKFSDTISSFAYAPGGLLMVVRNNELCYIDSLGKLSKLFGLPGSGMQITAGNEVVYLYGQGKGENENALYVLAKGGKYKELFVVPSPIRSVVEQGNSILFALENRVLRYNITNKKLESVVFLPDAKEIISVSVDPVSNRVYYATNDAIFALKDTTGIIITDKFGGVLRHYNNSLLVFNPQKQFLVRMSGLEAKIASVKLPEVPKQEEKINPKPEEKVAPQEVMELKQPEVPVELKPAPDTLVVRKKFFIIAGSFPTEQKAKEAVAGLRKSGFPDAEVVGKNETGNYRIAYKGYTSNEEALKDLIKIKQSENSSAWILRKE